MGSTGPIPPKIRWFQDLRKFEIQWVTSYRKQDWNYLTSAILANRRCFIQSVNPIRLYIMFRSDKVGRHDDVIKWKPFPRYWQFVRGIHRPLVNSPHKGQWRRAFMFSLICVPINGWENNREAGDLRRYRAHYVVIVMNIPILDTTFTALQSYNHRLHSRKR